MKKKEERLKAVEEENRRLREVAAERKYAAEICEMIRREIKMGRMGHEAWMNAWTLSCQAKDPCVKKAALEATEKLHAANQAAYEALKALRRVAEA